MKERAQRNLLLIIDGKTTAETLLARLAGITAADFSALESLGLIVPVVAPARAPAPAPAPPSADSGFGEAVDIDVSGQTVDVLRGAISLLISKQLGMRGFAMSMVLDGAMTIEDLKDVASEVIKKIGERKGPAAAAAAKRFLLKL